MRTSRMYSHNQKKRGLVAAPGRVSGPTGRRATRRRLFLTLLLRGFLGNRFLGFWLLGCRSHRPRIDARRSHVHIRFRLLFRGAGLGRCNPGFRGCRLGSRSNGLRLLGLWHRFRLRSRRSYSLLRNRLGRRLLLLGYRFFWSRRLLRKVRHRWHRNGFRLLGHRRGLKFQLWQRRLRGFGRLFRYRRRSDRLWLRHGTNTRLFHRLWLRSRSCRDGCSGNRFGRFHRFCRKFRRSYRRLRSSHRYFRRCHRSRNTGFAHRRPSRLTRDHHIRRARRDHRRRIAGYRLNHHAGRYINLLRLHRHHAALLRHAPHTPSLGSRWGTGNDILLLRRFYPEACCNKAARSSDNVAENVKQALRLNIRLRTACQGRLETNHTTH